MMRDSCGTPAYMAPEVIKCAHQYRDIAKWTNTKKKFKSKSQKDQKARIEIEENIKKIENEITGYSKKCDIWSAGVVMFAMLYGQLPFKGITTRDIKERIIDEKNEIMFFDSCSREAINLMTKMLDKNPETRININEILNHPWLADVGDNDRYPVFNKAERV